MTYIVSDPFNDRVKHFRADYSYNLPTNTGHLYFFNQSKALLFHDFQRVCMSLPIHNLNDLIIPLNYFANLNKIWTESYNKTKYYGKVKIRFEENDDESAELHMFYNNASFIKQVELDFD